jgi:acyl-CoA synthetase (AMP-forming)/AMP-acid ligase II
MVDDDAANTTLRELIERADAHPALAVPGGAEISYARLHRALDDAAARLRALGVEPESRVLLAFLNGPEVLLAFLATIACGAAAAPLNPALRAGEIRDEIDDLRIDRVLHDSATAGTVREAIASGGAIVPVHAVAWRDDHLEIEGAGTVVEPERPDPGAIALLLHTSGTTSLPKTVPIRQRNLVASVRTVANSYALDRTDVSMCVMPLFHVHGLVASALATLATGGTLVVPPRFSASSFWDDVRVSRATWYSAVPTIHSIALTKARELPGTPEHRLRFVRSCSAPLAVPTAEAFEAAIGVPIVEAYGMTEAAHQMATNPLPPSTRRFGTVGQATGVELATLDDDWQPVAVGERGEVAVRGSSVVDGYLDNPVANAECFRDGWFRTGDVGTMSDDGYLTLVGRIKELINRGGEKISPYEVEAVLLAHPAVSEAAVYPVPDETYGEQVGAVVVLREDVDPDALVRHCAEALAPFKVPARLTVRAEIPKGPTGKVQRRNLAGLVRA